jgi:hypothetical protein
LRLLTPCRGKKIRRPRKPTPCRTCHFARPSLAASFSPSALLLGRGAEGERSRS